MRIDCDEFYPFYWIDFSQLCQPYDDDPVIPADLVDRYKQVMRDFLAVQKEMHSLRYRDEEWQAPGYFNEKDLK